MWGRTNEKKKDLSTLWERSEGYVKKHELVRKEKQDERVVDRQTPLGVDRG